MLYTATTGVAHSLLVQGSRGPGKEVTIGETNNNHSASTTFGHNKFMLGAS